MTHSPQGRGIAARIKKNAVPALIRKKVDASGYSDRWRKFHDVEDENVDIYVILKDAEMELAEEGEEEKQWAVLYNVQKKLEMGAVIDFPDKGWSFLIRKSTQRPAINPNYFKAYGVMRD